MTLLLFVPSVFRIPGDFRKNNKKLQKWPLLRAVPANKGIVKLDACTAATKQKCAGKNAVSRSSPEHWMIFFAKTVRK